MKGKLGRRIFLASLFLLLSISNSWSASITGFTPLGGQADTTVTINGIDFNPTSSLNTVLFNGVQATVTAATATSLTVKVPAGATTGIIQVTTAGEIALSADNFIVAAPITLQGTILTSSAVAIAGARIEKSGNPSVFTTSAADGSYSLGWFSGQPIGLKITGDGYLATYTAEVVINTNQDQCYCPSHLYTQAELISWGVAADKCAVVGQVLSSAVSPHTPVTGTIITAQSSQNYPAYYDVSYYNGTSFSSSSTYGNGLFFLRNANPNDWVTLSASKSAWEFSSTGINTYENSVSEIGVFGRFVSPQINSFAPASAKVGQNVTIYGKYFSNDVSGYTVKFNGVTASVISSGSTSLTVTVPVGATTGLISITTTGGTVYSGAPFAVLHTLSASVAGSEGGTLTSSPPGIACTSSDSTSTGCSVDFNQGAEISLTATEQAGYRFKEWNGDCTGFTAQCSLILGINTSVSATFEELLYIKIGAKYYSLLKNAFDSAINNDIIQVQNQVFTDNNLVFNKVAVKTTLKGGYDNSFNTNSGYTTIVGKLSIRSGLIRVEKLKIR